MAQIDWIIVLLCFLLVSLYVYSIYKGKKKTEAGLGDFFPAKVELTWPAIGTSLRNCE